MARAFAKIAFTPAVQAAQSRFGSRSAYQTIEQGETEPVALGPFEAEFIAERDSFYQGTVGENGWPYVQHRGGPPGFLKVLGPRTIGYAEFSGNRQYISVGNLTKDDRVSLILMDYAGQRRLKIWGRARLIDEMAEPALLAQLESPHYRAPVERGILITVEAFDWNCPKHITPRFTEAQMASVFAEWQRTASAHENTATQPEALGHGPHALVVVGLRQLTPRVRAYELQTAHGGALPGFSAGAHLSVPVQLANGQVVTRQYSLMPSSTPQTYEIAVLRDDSGRGASAAIHAHWGLGTQLAVDAPENQFPLHDDSRPAVLIAGGIGITPIRAMAQALQARGLSFALHYSAPNAKEMAYREALTREFPEEVKLYFSQTPGGRMDVQTILREASDDAICYVCGPRRLIEAVKAAAQALALPAWRIQYESFE